jgi:hypothetical protein
MVPLKLDILANFANYVIQRMATVDQIARRIIVMDMEHLLAIQMGFVHVQEIMMQGHAVPVANGIIEEKDVLNV